MPRLAARAWADSDGTMVCGRGGGEVARVCVADVVVVVVVCVCERACV